jgi:hypothetical protein
VEATRRTYIELPPDGQNVIIYGGPLICDSCED